MKFIKLTSRLLTMTCFMFMVMTLSSCFSNTRAYLDALSEKYEMPNRKGKNYTLKIRLAAEPRTLYGKAFDKGETEYGYFAVFVDDAKGQRKMEGSEFWITNLSGIGSNSQDFDLVYVDARGKRKLVADNRLTLHGKDSVSVVFSKEAPFASQCGFHITFDNDYPFPKPIAFASSVYPKLRNYSTMYSLGYTGGWWERGLWGIFIVVLIYLLVNNAWNMCRYFLVGGILTLGSIYQSWVLFLPLLLPFYIALFSMLIPFIRKYSKSIFNTLSVVSFFFFAWRFILIEGFWMGIWMSLYTLSGFLLSEFIGKMFDNLCPICGRILSNARLNNAYTAAEDILCVPLNSQGEQNLNLPVIYSGETYKTDNKNVCYWCVKENE